MSNVSFADLIPQGGTMTVAEKPRVRFDDLIPGNGKAVPLPRMNPRAVAMPPAPVAQLAAAPPLPSTVNTFEQSDPMGVHKPPAPAAPAPAPAAQLAPPPASQPAVTPAAAKPIAPAVAPVPAPAPVAPAIKPLPPNIDTSEATNPMVAKPPVPLPALATAGGGVGKSLTDAGLVHAGILPNPGPVTDIVTKAVKGFGAGFGKEPLGLQPGSDNYNFLKRNGLITDSQGPGTGVEAPWYTTEGMTRGVATFFDAVGRTFQGVIGGVQGATTETAKQLGSSESDAEQIGNDVGGMAEAWFLQGGSGVHSAEASRPGTAIAPREAPQSVSGFDPYRELGVPADASPEAISAAYRTKAKQTHPDAPGGSREAFAKVSLAYGILKDKAARAWYDQTGIVREQAARAQEPAAGDPRSTPQPASTSNPVNGERPAPVPGGAGGEAPMSPPPAAAPLAPEPNGLQSPHSEAPRASGATISVKPAGPEQAAKAEPVIHLPYQSTEHAPETQAAIDAAVTHIATSPHLTASDRAAFEQAVPGIFDETHQDASDQAGAHGRPTAQGSQGPATDIAVSGGKGVSQGNRADQHAPAVPETPVGKGNATTEHGPEPESARVETELAQPKVAAYLHRDFTIDRKHDVPYLAGYSKDGKTIFIDRHLPETIKVGDKQVDPTGFILRHESVEKALIDTRGFTYQQAHEIATSAEHADLQAAGHDKAAYEKALKPFIEAAGRKELTKVPHDLDLAPYEDSNAHALIERIKSAQGGPHESLPAKEPGGNARPDAGVRGRTENAIEGSAKDKTLPEKGGTDRAAAELPAGHEEGRGGSQPAVNVAGTRHSPVEVTSPEHLTTATSRTLPEPSPAQAEAGNYTKHHINLHGMDIAIETPKGAVRRGTGADGQPWEVKMPTNYGYIKRTQGADGDHVDVNVGDKPQVTKAFVIDQVDPKTGAFDEHKAFLGVPTEHAVRSLYARSFSDGQGDKRIGAVTEMPIEQFKKWAESGNTKQPLSPFIREKASAEPRADDKAARKAASPPAAKSSAQTSRIEDAGEKIGGARKDRWRERGLTEADLHDMTPTEEVEHVKKDNVWKVPNYQAMIEGGVSREAAAAIKIMRDRLVSKPKADNAEERRRYLKMVTIIRDEAHKAKTVEDLRGLQGRVLHTLGWNSEDQAGWKKTDTRATLFSAFTGRTAKLDVTGYEAQRRINAMLAEGWPTPARRERTVGEDGQPKLPERPHLDHINRTGKEVRNGRDIGSHDFVKDFGFRGVEFGNWVASDERQKVVNHAYEALHDLADVMGVPARAISLGDHLALAFGARGSGKAAAHYEPGRMVINMTKLSGAGSLAHEWGHALDHYYGALNRDTGTRGTPQGASGWYTRGDYSGRARPKLDHATGMQTVEHRLPNLRPELAQAFDHVMSALFEKNKGKAETVRNLELNIESAKARIAAQEKSLTTPGVSAKFTRDAKNYIEHTQRIISATEKRLGEVRNNPNDHDPSFGKEATNYAKEAQHLTGKSVSGYWTRPTEMFARAFESYVQDKIGTAENVSEYLVHGTTGGVYTRERGFKGDPYPAGPERQAINEAFDHLVHTVETKTDEAGAVHLGNTIERASTTPEFKKWFHESKVVDHVGEPLIVYHGSNRSFSQFKPTEGMRQEGGRPFAVTSPAFFFSPDREVAQMFARDRVQIDEKIRGKSGGRAQTAGYYLSAKNPLDLTGGRFFGRVPDPETAAIVGEAQGGYDGPQTWAEVHQALDDQHVVDELRAQGYDAVHLREENGSHSWAVFAPSQIKSIANRGAFDANDPRTMFKQSAGDASRIKLDPRQRANLETALRSKVAELIGPGRAKNVSLEHTIPVKGAGDAAYNSAMEKYAASGGNLGETAGGAVRIMPSGEAFIRLATNDPKFPAMGSARHEPYHVVEATLMTDKEFAAVNAAENMAKLREHAMLELGVDPATNRERADALPHYEARAIAYERYDRMRDEGFSPAEAAKGTGGGLHGTLARFFEKVRSLIARIRNMLTGKGYTRYQDIFEDIHQGEMANREARQPVRDLTRGGDMKLASAAEHEAEPISELANRVQREEEKTRAFQQRRRLDHVGKQMDANAEEMARRGKETLAAMKEARIKGKAIPAFMEKVIHYRENLSNPKAQPTFSSGELTVYRDHLEPLFDLHKRTYVAIQGMLTDLTPEEAERYGGMLNPEYVPHVVLGKGSAYDRAVAQQGNVIVPGRRMPISAAPLKSSSYYALQNDAGQRVIVSQGKTGLIHWQNGKAVTGKGSFPAGAELKLGKSFKTKAGDTWTVTRARLAEKEQHTPSRYYKNAFALLADSALQLQHVELALKHFDELTHEPDWQRLASPRTAPQPNGWVNVDAPGLRSFWLHPRLAAPYLDYLKGSDPILKLGQTFENFNRIAIGSLFVSPFPHVMNVAAHWFVARGWDWINPAGYARAMVAGARAAKSITSLDDRYLSYLRSGAPLLYARSKNSRIIHDLFHQMGQEIEKDNGGRWSRVARATGFQSLADMVKAYYRAVNRSMWYMGDWFMLARIMEMQMPRVGGGYSRGEAIAHTRKAIPDYVVMPEVLGSRLLSRMIQDSNMTNFGRYRYGQVGAILHDVKDVVLPKGYEEKTGQFSKRGVHLYDRGAALGRLVMLGVAVMFVKPVIDKLFQQMLGDPNYKERNPGALSIVQDAIDLMDGKDTAWQTVQRVWGPSPGINAAWGILTNHDMFLQGWDSYPNKAGDTLSTVRKNEHSILEKAWDEAQFIVGTTGLGQLTEAAFKQGLGNVLESQFLGGSTPSAAQLKYQKEHPGAP